MDTLNLDNLLTLGMLVLLQAVLGFDSAAQQDVRGAGAFRPLPRGHHARIRGRTSGTSETTREPRLTNDEDDVLLRAGDSGPDGRCAGALPEEAPGEAGGTVRARGVSGGYVRGGFLTTHRVQDGSQSGRRRLRAFLQPALRTPASSSSSPMRRTSSRLSRTSGGRTWASSKRPSRTRASFIRLCMSSNGSL